MLDRLTVCLFSYPFARVFHHARPSRIESGIRIPFGKKGGAS